MGSFGMDWNQKSSVLWDWENLPPPIGGVNAGENPKNGMQDDPRFAATMGNEAPHSSGGSGTFSSSSEMGYGSSKSSMSASIDSSSKVGNNMEFRFAPAKNTDRNTSKNTELGKVDNTRRNETSPSSAVAASSGEPVIGLKLGKRTYFEDVCGGQSVKTSPSGTSAPNKSPALVKKAKVDQHKPHNSYCQVEGCKVDLSPAKEYHRKHRVCETHSKAPKVVVAGLERRFCQQCSRFHALAEFDQVKRSCRRRLNDHNSRRRKPQPEAISFGSSRLSSMFYDARQSTNLLFGQAPYVQMRSSASSWDDPGGFKFTETKAPWLKPTAAAGIDGMHLSSQQVSVNIMPHGAHHGFDGFMSFKGTGAKFLNQGVEASAVASDSSRAPDIQRALSLLSSNSMGAANLQQSPQMHPGVAATSGFTNPAMHAVGSSPGLWLDGPQLDDHPQFQVFDRLGGHHSELQLPKSSYGHASHFDRMH